jgi:2-keto-myo-inositol isomerase
MRSCLNAATTMPYTFQQDVSAAGQAGFEGVEIWWPKLRSYLKTHSTEEAKTLLDEHNVKPVGLCPLLIWPFRDTEAERQSYREAVEVASQIGCQMLTICPDFQPATMTQEEAFAAHAEEISRMATIAADYNVRLAIEPIGGHTLVPGPAEALKLIQMVGSPPHVGVLLDTFHYLKSRVSDEEIRKIPIQRLFIVHLNDCEDRPLDELRDEHRLYPTLGIIPLKKRLALLRDMGYDGYISVEVFRPEYWKQPADDIAHDAFFYFGKLMQTL